MEDQTTYQRRRRRRLRKCEGPPVPNEGTLEVRRLEIDGRHYVLRYVRCGRDCQRCNEQHESFDPLHPGHGPYWYRELTNPQGRKIRRYVGKTLTADGEVKR